MKRVFLAGLVVMLMWAVPLTQALAVTPDEVLPDAALETRAREISQLLRCVVCQNQSIDDSNAPLAKDLRVLVRERLTAGDSNAQTLNYIVARYGNFVLLKPPVQINTLLLWFGPALLFALAAFGLFKTLKRQEATAATGAAAPLSKADEARLGKLLKDDAEP
ncbi:MAG: cytochrome c-type biogenesis protein [Hyphomicrobiaceae bacterium]